MEHVFKQRIGIRTGMKTRQTTSQSRIRFGKERGVTLIELFLGLLIASILGTIIYAVITSQSRAYGIQERETYMQQSSRMAMQFISRDVSMAGYGSPGYVVTDSDLGISGLLPAIRGFDGGMGLSDVLQVVYVDPTHMAMTRWGINQMCDTTVIQFQNLEDVYLFVDSEYMLCFDFSSVAQMKSFLVRLTGYDAATGELQPGSYDPSGGTIKVEVPDNTTHFSVAGGQCPPGENLPRDLQCGPAFIHTYYIDNNEMDGVGPGTPQHPVLMLSDSIQAVDDTGRVTQVASIHGNDMALADNIELLQLKVCRVSYSTKCEDQDFEDWPASLNTTTSVTELRQVRIMLWARSDRRASEGTKTGDLNPLFGFEDGFYRRMEASTVLVRNLRLLSEYN